MSAVLLLCSRTSGPALAGAGDGAGRPWDDDRLQRAELRYSEFAPTWPCWVREIEEAELLAYVRGVAQRAQQTQVVLGFGRKHINGAFRDVVDVELYDTWRE